jgi:AcrR family transcriptional regulator
MPPSQNKAITSKNYIAGKAKDLFSQKGYFLTTMEDICKHTQMSKGNIYHHFKNKESLFIYILEVHVDDWIAAWNRDSNALPSAKEKLYLLAQHFALDYENPLMQAAGEFSMSPVADAEAAEKAGHMVKGYYPIIRTVVEEGMDKGEFKKDNIDDLSLVLFGLMSGVGTICYSMNKKCDQVYLKAITSFLEGIEV